MEMNSSVNKTNIRLMDKNKQGLRNMFPVSFGEEVGNSVTHGVATLVFIFLLPFSAIYLYATSDITHAVGGSIFIISIILMFLSSTFYHVMAPDSEHKYVMRLLDHSLIFVAIAGTYTPIALTLISGTLGIIVLVVQWAAAILGILYKVLSKNPSGKISMIFYMVMGWMFALFVPTILLNAPLMFVLLILFGGIMYTVGAWFYAQKHRRYFHMIWHLFIIVASTSHYIAIVFFLVN